MKVTRSIEVKRHMAEERCYLPIAQIIGLTIEKVVTEKTTKETQQFSGAHDPSSVGTETTKTATVYFTDGTRFEIFDW